VPLGARNWRPLLSETCSSSRRRGGKTTLYRGRRHRGRRWAGSDLHHHPPGAIQELTVAHQQLSAEYGRTTGAALNLVTRSGTNQVTPNPGPLPAGRPAVGRAGHQAALARQLQQESGFVGALVRAAPMVRGAEYNEQNRDSVITSLWPPRLHRPVQADPPSSAAWISISARASTARRFDSTFSDTKSAGRGGTASPCERGDLPPQHV